MIKTYRLKLPDTSIAKTLPLATVLGISLQNIICSDTSSSVLENLDLISTKHLSFVSKSFYASINYQTPDLKTRCIFKDILDPQNCYPEHWRSIEGLLNNDHDEVCFSSKQFNKELSVKALIFICKFFENHPFVNDFDPGAGLTDDHVPPLVELMKKNTTIHTYNFSCSDFTDVGITALAKAIQDSPNITSINLGYNEFSFLAFLNISNAIREHPGLRQLLIYGPYNFIDKDIADVLSLALENNNRIEDVCFEETEFSFDAAQLFLRRLKNHPSIDINRLSYEIINNETFSYDQKNSLRNSLSD